ncbi:MAG: hypothetical protein K2J67_05510 [Lachnospiraceae bacterium]|nr:hypothetical protein [Lachnospiraceae bacterium]
MTEDWREVLKDIVFMLFTMAGAFCIINVAWYWGIKTRYDDAIYDLYQPVFTEWKNPEEAPDGMYEIIEDGYRYRVYETKYLKSSGFFCISAESGWIDESERPNCVTAEDGTNIILNIGFKLFSRYSFQLDIENENERYQIMVDKKGKLIKNE